MKIIQNNPYRQLGVYANSPTRERVANHNRLNAFLKVGKKVDFPLDLTHYLPPINRTSETVTQAESELALPNDQLKYAQFWFIKVTPLDDIAFNHLLAGNMDAAIRIWEKKDCASSLQNRIICALIKNEFASAVAYAEQLYTQHSQPFVTAIFGASSDNNAHPSLAFDFIDKLCDETGASTILPVVTDAQWKGHITEKQITPLIASIQSAIDTAKSSRGKGCTARYNAGTKLMNDTKEPLSQIKKFLSTDDLKYQMIADKLAQEILQCGIDYFNVSNAQNAAQKAMKLQLYALSIAVGKMAKDRCKENVDILQKIIDDLPPAEVFEEDKAIKEELKKFCNLPDKICHSVALLNNTKPYLQRIKGKLGASNSYYLKISTSIVGNALHNVIEEVNALQNDPTFRRNMIIDKAQALISLKNVLRAAWNAIVIMDTFDMEAGFKNNRYLENRRTLSNMCSQVGISTRPSHSHPTPTPTPRPSDPSPRQYGPSSNESNKMSGDVAYLIGVLVIGIIGAFVILVAIVKGNFK